MHKRRTNLATRARNKHRIRVPTPISSGIPHLFRSTLSTKQQWLTRLRKLDLHRCLSQVDGMHRTPLMAQASRQHLPHILSSRMSIADILRAFLARRVKASRQTALMEHYGAHMKRHSKQ
ncbi:hypothetical protein FIBSPDRAFT_114002 [Athelia psychrophila]|uniref:Uncharacterized protein n=1 Tax=Athelia psychrophila TaxID=1759441 RepID=A0A166D5D5_9AGAM|nr:hypothetical protein FIBSPDRAFT_114002 [Fibularhizoctonia sp. CBS 109695]